MKIVIIRTLIVLYLALGLAAIGITTYVVFSDPRLSMKIFAAVAALMLTVSLWFNIPDLRSDWNLD